jgi:Transposase DDE domain/Domain of unknown function (DUF4372)
MSKSTIFSGQPILSQVLELIPPRILNRIERDHGANRYYKKFFLQDHLIAMLYACFQNITSLRDLTSGLLASSGRLQHLGIKNVPRRSTVAEGNMHRNAEIFQDLYHSLARHYFKFSPDSRSIIGEGRLYLMDSSTVTLFTDVMQGAGTYRMDGKKKGGAKVHTLYDYESRIPTMMRITEAKVNDIDFMHHLILAPGSIIVMDKGFNSYEMYRKWNETGITWVTRMNEAAVIQVIGENLLQEEEKKQGVLKDQLILLGNPKTTRPIKTRLITLWDKKKDRVFKFISNDLKGPAIRISEIYKARWEIEMYFKRVKQNFPLKYFLGDSENAIKIQIWCCLICDLLVRLLIERVKQMKKRVRSYSGVCSTIRIHLNTYVNLVKFLANEEKALIEARKPPDLIIQPALF